MTTEDIQHIDRAIELAVHGRGHTGPNPIVGAVIVRDGEVLGEGFHASYGGPHAEVAAISACVQDPIGSTMYVSLEPCCHQGKTPPCTEAIVDAGIRRIVVASDDPTEKASGRGLGILRDEGVDVVTADGEQARAARMLNQPFRKHARTGIPHVIFKSAISLDGKVATQTGDSKWISGEQSRELVHRWRAQVDAICVGIGTALADDPMLTARAGAGAGAGASASARQPRRVIFDSQARLPLDSNLVQTAPEVPLTVIVGRSAERPTCESLKAAGAELIVASGGTESERVVDALAKLGDAGVQSVLLEGGPRLAGSFLDAGQIDEMRMFIAPIAVGGRGAKVAFEGEGSESIAEAQQALSLESRPIGEDLLVEARLKEW